LRTDGAYGLIRVGREGTVTAAHLVGGRQLRLGDYELTGQRGWSGTVRGFERPRDGESAGYFDVTAVDADAHGTFFLEFPDDTVRAFNVVRIEPIDGGSRVHVREDPGF